MKLVANDRSDKWFLLTSKFCPWCCLPLTRSYIHLLKHEKMCLKSEVDEIHFKLQQMTIGTGLSVDIKILDLMSCLPLPKGYVLFLFLDNLRAAP